MPQDQLNMTIAFLAGLLSFLSPCVLPLFPSYLSFITGMSVGDLTQQQGRSRRQVALHSLAFIVGFSAVFVILGVSFSTVSQLLFDYRNAVRMGGGLLVILFGLYLSHILRPTWFTRSAQMQLKSKPAGYLGSTLVGIAFAAGWTPCVGPILGSILALAGTAETMNAGVSLLSAYSLGLALPFFVASLVLDRFLLGYSRFRWLIPYFERAAGFLLVLVGLVVVTNYMSSLNSYLISITPEWLLRRL